MHDEENYILGKSPHTLQTTTQLTISPQTFNWENVPPQTTKTLSMSPKASKKIKMTLQFFQ
jgi:hypothetical protein